MIAWVARIATYAREDLFFQGNDRQPAEETRSGREDLARFITLGKPVSVIEYGTSMVNKSDATESANQVGYVHLLAPRELDVLTVTGR